jgi:hypothetical protein
MKIMSMININVKLATLLLKLAYEYATREDIKFYISIVWL